VGRGGRSFDFARREAALLFRAGLSFYRNHGFTSGAALGFWGLLALIPFVLFASGLFGLLVDYVGGADDAALMRQILTGLQRFFPRLDPEAARYLEDVFARRETLSLAASPLFLLMCAALLGTLEGALAVVLHPGRKRSIGRSAWVTLLFVVILLCGVVAFVMAGSTLAQLAGDSARWFSDFMGHPASTWSLGVAIGATLFAVLVRTFALERIPWTDLARGGLFFGLFWLAARLGFGWYLDVVAAYDLLYGSLAVLVVLILWMYYTAVLFLFAAEWMAARRRALDDEIVSRSV
jgi:membrane protein